MSAQKSPEILALRGSEGAERGVGGGHYPKPGSFGAWRLGRSATALLLLCYYLFRDCGVLGRLGCKQGLAR